MKLQCNVEVVNRLHTTLNVRSSGKYVKSTLALGKEPKAETDYFILYFSTVNKNGTKYRVKCIKQVFVKFINDGKTTIRFEEPPHDLCIKSEAIQLKCFMRVLKSCISGDAKSIPLNSLSNLSVTAKDIAPIKLVVRDRSEFPPQGLPRTLESLHINGLKLCNFRREILLLKHLTVLDMSNNEIEKLPVEFGRMPNLCELHLSNNQLGKEGEIDWRWLLGLQITKTLKQLDLSGNNLKYLPKSIWKLQRLITLKLDNNQLSQLPASLGRIHSLRYLTISQNSLESLPCGLMQCRLEHLDLSSNKFGSKNTSKSRIQHQHTHWDFYVGNLVNLASKIVLKYNFFYAPNILPRTLVEYLDSANMCICGAPVLNEIYYVRKEFQLREFFRSVVFDNSSVEFDCHFCSFKCLKKVPNLFLYLFISV